MATFGKRVPGKNSIICWSCYLEQPDVSDLPKCQPGYCLRPGEYPEDSELYKQHTEDPYKDDPRM
jgi:hypothetical protein